MSTDYACSVFWDNAYKANVNYRHSKKAESAALLLG